MFLCGGPAQRERKKHTHIAPALWKSAGVRVVEAVQDEGDEETRVVIVHVHCLAYLFGRL